MAPEFAVDQLDCASRRLRKLRRQNFLPLFRSGTGYCATFPRNLAKLSMAGGDRILDFYFLPHHRNIY
jgi:hypothetical protein